MTLYRVRPDDRGTRWEELEARRLDLLEEEARTGGKISIKKSRFQEKIPNEYSC
jgi:hypothetical protein